MRNGTFKRGDSRNPGESYSDRSYEMRPLGGKWLPFLAIEVPDPLGSGFVILRWIPGWTTLGRRACGVKVSLEPPGEFLDRLEWIRVGGGGLRLRYSGWI